MSQYQDGGRRAAERAARAGVRGPDPFDVPEGLIDDCGNLDPDPEEPESTEYTEAARAGLIVAVRAALRRGAELSPGGRYSPPGSRSPVRLFVAGQPNGQGARTGARTGVVAALRSLTYDEGVPVFLAFAIGKLEAEGASGQWQTGWLHEVERRTVEEWERPAIVKMKELDDAAREETGRFGWYAPAFRLGPLVLPGGAGAVPSRRDLPAAPPSPAGESLFNATEGGK